VSLLCRKLFLFGAWLVASDDLWQGITSIENKVLLMTNPQVLFAATLRSRATEKAMDASGLSNVSTWADHLRPWVG